MTGVIYTLCDPRMPDEIRYVGQTRIGPRLRRWHHINDATKGRTKTWSANWIRKLLSEGVEPLMRVVAVVNVDGLSEAERQWIRLCRDAGHRLTNITDGGEGHTGRLRPEHAAKIAEWHRGRRRSEETRRRISEAKTGKKLSDEAVERRKEAVSRPEVRDKYREAARRRWADPEYRRRTLEGLAKRPGNPKKLSWDAVREIRKQHVEGATVRGLARTFSVSPAAVRAIVRHEVWREEMAS